MLKLPAGSDEQTVLPFTGVSVPWGLCGGQRRHGALCHRAQQERRAELAVGSNAPTQLPFEGLNTPLDVVVGKDGTVYVANRGNNRVVKLAPS